MRSVSQIIGMLSVSRQQLLKNMCLDVRSSREKLVISEKMLPLQHCSAHV